MTIIPEDDPRLLQSAGMSIVTVEQVANLFSLWAYARHKLAICATTSANSGHELAVKTNICPLAK